MVGLLLLDTDALAKQGTASTTVRARTENDFMKRASQGVWCAWRIAYVVRTLEEVASHCYNFGGI
jgi:hypothetical protein